MHGGCSPTLPWIVRSLEAGLSHMRERSGIVITRDSTIAPIQLTAFTSPLLVNTVSSDSSLFLNVLAGDLVTRPPTCKGNCESARG